MSGWSVRGRLVAVYTVVALLLGLAAAALFTVQLRAGLRTSLDVALDARMAPLVVALAQPGTPDLPDTPPTVARAPEPAGSVEALTVVYDPAGRVADAQPLTLPGALLTPAELAAARSGPLRLTRPLAGTEVRLLATPVARADGTWVVVVGTDEGTAHEAVDQADRLLGFGGLAVLALAVAGAWLLSGAALRPVERLRRDAAELGAHDPAGRLREPGTGDELTALARTFNALLDRLHRSLARQRDLVADAGHELRTPLAVLRTELELADRPHRSRAELAEAVAHARTEVERLSRLAEDLLFLARADGGAPLLERRRIDVAALLEEAARGSRAAAGPVELAVRAPAGLVAEVDAAALRRALDNLLANAIRAVGDAPAGRVSLAAAVDAGRLAIEVTDTGPGFPPEFLPHAFERFRVAAASRSAAGGGTGLGLAIVAEIAAAHGGTATADNPAGGGARVRLDLPA